MKKYLPHTPSAKTLIQGHSIGEKLPEISTDDDTRQGAIRILCYTYADRGERERARTLAAKMAEMCVSRESLMTHIERGDELYHAIVAERDRLLDMLVRNITSNPVMDNGSRAYTEDEWERLQEKAIAFLRLMYEDGDYGFYNSRLVDLYEFQSHYFANKRDEAGSLEALRNAADAVLRFLDYAGKRSVCIRRSCSAEK